MVDRWRAECRARSSSGDLVGRNAVTTLRWLVIAGPTASGKSALSLDVAERLGGEIVNADSRQIYRYMDIGTDKPTIEQRKGIPHHMIDLVEPDEPYTLALYQEGATRVIEEIHGRRSTHRVRHPATAPAARRH